MKKNIYLMLFLVFAIPFALFAQEQPVVSPDVSFLQDLIGLLGGAKGMSTVAIVLAVTQVLYKFLSTSFAEKLLEKFDAAKKMLLAQGLTIVISVVTLVSQGVPTAEIVVKTLGAAAVQEFLFQIYKNFIQKQS